MRKMQRIGAIAGVVILVGIVIATLFFAVTGSRYFMASLFAMIVVPIFIYGYMTIFRVMSNSDKEQWKAALEQKEEDLSDDGDQSHKDSGKQQ